MVVKKRHVEHAASDIDKKMDGVNRCNHNADVYCIQDILLNNINHSHQALIWVEIWVNASRNRLKPLDVVLIDV